MKHFKQNENHRGVAVHENDDTRVPDGGRLAVTTNRADFLAAHPEARRIHELHVAKFRSGLSSLVDGGASVDADIDRIMALWAAGEKDRARALFDEVVANGLPLKLVLNSVIIKADNAREVGLNLLEWQRTLPGGKLTVDLFEQHKHELVDGHGQPVRFELLEWFMQMARNEKSEINSFLAAIKHKQLLLAAAGDGAFALEAERPPQHAVDKPDERVELMKLFQPALLQTRWSALKANPNYFRDGRIVPSMRHIVEKDWSEYFKVLDEVRAALGD